LEFAVGKPSETGSAFHWMAVCLNLPGMEELDLPLPWVMKLDPDGDIATEGVVIFFDDGRCTMAKIDVSRNCGDKQPLCTINALLTEIMLQHQHVDPTFQFFPTEEGSTAGAITTASDIPTNKAEMKKYMKEMRDVINRITGVRCTMSSST
jgi:hypothetical protein